MCHFVPLGAPLPHSHFRVRAQRLLGDDSITPAITVLVRGDLCNALVEVLSHGFKAKRLFGRNHLWDIFLRASKNVTGEEARAAPALLPAFSVLTGSPLTGIGVSFASGVNLVDELVERSACAGDKDIKFRTLMCHALKFRAPPPMAIVE